MSDPVPDFDWDQHNIDHIAPRGITPGDVAEVFSDPFRIAGDAYTRLGEARYAVIGSTADRRVLLVAYTLRGGRVRVVTARFAHRCELRTYWAGRR